MNFEQDPQFNQQFSNEKLLKLFSDFCSKFNNALIGGEQVMYIISCIKL